MSTFLKIFLGLLLTLMALAQLPGCVHEPIRPLGNEPTPVDTTRMDTTPEDTSQNDTFSVKPCDPDTVYFSQDVLPILISNCAKSGCHDAASASDGVILTDYAAVMRTADVRAGNPGGSDLYEVLTEDDPDKRMPQPPNDPLNADQIALIRKWIQQGARDLTCGDTTQSGGCDTANVSFAQDIRPILTTYCTGCHSSPNPSGNLDLTVTANVQQVAQSGQLYGVTARLTGYPPMPLGGDPLPACHVAKIKAWVDAGAQDN